MSDLQIRLLGQFKVTLQGEVVSNFASDKVRALLAYLVSESNVPHRRETLAHLLWPDKPDATARASLRQALSNLRKALGDHQADPPHLLISRQDIQFNSKSDAWIDVAVLTRNHAPEKASSQNVHHFDEIHDIYQGVFLAGFNLPESLPFDEWVLLKREQYAIRMVTILQQASDYHEKRGDYEATLRFTRRHVELDPWQESARRRLMRLLYNTGRRDQALQQFQDLQEALRTELDIEPEPKTRQLYETIQEGKQDSITEICIEEEEGPPSFPAFLKEEAFAQVSTPETFVGRKLELDRLHGYLDAVMEGRGALAMVAGEAGSGKTMLLQEFIRQAQSRHSELVSSSGYSNAFTGIGDPYLPFREILYQLSGDIQTHWKAGSFSRQYALNLWKAIPLCCKSLLKHGPDLVDTILPGQTLLEHAESYAKAQPTWYRELQAFVTHRKQHPGSGVQQANLLSQFSAVLQNIAREVPLLLFVDDLQWADTGTIAMFFHLAKQIPGSRIMLVGAYRSEEVGLSEEGERHPLAPVLHELKRDYGDVFLHLDESSGKAFVQEMVASEPHDLEESFQEQLYHLTGGNALFTVEILQSLAETGTLTRDGSGFRVLSSDFHLESLPPRIEGILAERIGRMPQDLQRILQLASIEGEIFTAEIIAALEELPIEQVVSLLSDQLDKQHRLVRAQQIRWQDDRSISTYRFRHFLFQKFLYDQLDEISRARFHNRVGSLMETMYEEDIEPHAVHLARHFHEANQTEKAVKYYSMAGRRAVRMSAYPEAISQFEAAINQLLTLPETLTRNEQEVNLQLQLGVAYQSIMGYAHEQVGAAYQRALNLCQTLGVSDKMNIALHLLFSYYANIAELGTANEIMTMLENYYHQHESVYASLLDWGYGYLDSIMGKHKAAFECFTKVLEHYNQADFQVFTENVGMEPGLFCHGWAGLHAAWLGYPDQARDHIRATFRIAENYDSKLFSSIAFWFGSWINLELQDMTLAREYNRSLLEITGKEGYYLFDAMARVFRGRMLSSEGKHQEALESIEKGLAMYSMTGALTGQSTIFLAYAEAHCAAGQVEAGLDAVSKADQFERETGEARHLASLQKVKGDLYLLGEDEDAAEKAYLSAISVAQRESAKLLELEAVKPLARLWQHQGKVKQAMQMLQEVYDGFTEGFDTPMMVEA
ncbi:MAG: DUF2791 family P-loop domain-containing protein, partial [Anaerolineales bacterium]